MAVKLGQPGNQEISMGRPAERLWLKPGCTREEMIADLRLCAEDRRRAARLHGIAVMVVLALALPILLAVWSTDR